MKVGVLALFTCTVLEFAIATSATTGLGGMFWSHSDPRPSPTHVISPPSTPATAAAQSAPEASVPQSAVSHQFEPQSAPDPSRSSLTQEPVRVLHIWLTGYSFQDNTPPGSAIVSAPAVHKTAGGTGTYADPITVAVPGHADDRNMAWQSGTRFYLPTVQRYAIVEDSGASPAPSGQDGHLDMWVDGQGGSKSASDRCMDKITGVGIPAIINPPADAPVMVGPITSNGTCLIPASTNN